MTIINVAKWHELVTVVKARVAGRVLVVCDRETSAGQALIVSRTTRPFNYRAVVYAPNGEVWSAKVWVGESTYSVNPTRKLKGELTVDRILTALKLA
jgi:hypothetical protein